MLVLTRRVGERIRIGNDIEIMVVRVQGGAVRLGIDAPPHVAIARPDAKESSLGQEASLAQS